MPLRVKSNFSFLCGASHPYELAERAAEYKLPAFALTDLDSLAGVVQAHTALQGSGTRLIPGAEVTLAGDDAFVDGRNLAGRNFSVAGGRFSGGGFSTGGTVLLLPRNRRGYGDLSSLISAGRLSSPKGESSVTIDQVCAHGKDLVLIWTEPREVPDDVVDAFSGRLYLGISRHGKAGEAAMERLIGEEARRLGLPRVAAPEILYHDQSRRHLQDVLSCIRRGDTLESAGDRLRRNALHALMDGEMVGRMYHDRPELLRRTLEIAERCRFSLSEITYTYPRIPGSDDRGDGEILRDVTMRGARRRYPDGIPEEVLRQLKRELDTIGDLKYDGYFLTVWEIVRYCREHGILCQGRGSAANSAVCYCLGVTAVDPVRMQLLFERFLSRERAEPPDIDIDIEHRRREEVIQFVYDRYGRDHAAMVCNVVRYRRRSAVRDVGKAFGIELATVERMAKMLGHRGVEIEEAAELAGLKSETPVVRYFIELAEEIREFPRHLSIHPGGFLLGTEPIATIVPIENATMPGRTVIQWDKYAVEDMNLFKVDLLGLGALTHLDYAFRLLQAHRGVHLSMASIPQDCRRTFAMLRRGESVGVFQLESRAQMAMLPRMKPETFYDLVIEISIIRPGPISGGMVHPYLRRRAGEEKVTYPHSSLQPVLERTLGIPLFQEQVMKLAVIAAHYTPGEADRLRRDMAAWRWGGKIEQHRVRMIERMVSNGIDRTFAERVFEQIRGFGKYGFPESHAAGFSLIAYSTAWLREHYPAEFTCALLNAWPMGFYSPATIIGEARRRGLEIRPIDILYSHWECTLEEAPGAPGDYAVRMGLRFVQFLGKDDWERIQVVRQKRRAPMRRVETGYSASIACRKPQIDPGAGDTPSGATTKEFIAALELRENVLRSLAQAGAFRSFGVQRRSAFWESLGISAVGAEERAPQTAGSREADTWTLFGVAGVNPQSKEPEIHFADLSSFETVAWDYLSAQHSTSAHPIEPFRRYLRGEGYPSAEEVRRMADGSFVRYVGMVICRQRPDTAAGTVFLTLEDETGFVNLIVWPDRFEKFKTTLLTGSFLAVSGKLQQRDSVHHLVIERAWHPELPVSATALPSRDFH